MIHLGDITKINGADIPAIDVVTGGSPCQDLSVAKANRAGLAGERSGLFMEQIRIIKEMREASGRKVHAGQSIQPRYMLWENVVGSLSANGGRDFHTILQETARIAEPDAVIPEPPKKRRSNGTVRYQWTAAGAVVGDGWSIAWRVHDAQFWGTPQRRKRIALVADFGGQSALEILFERKSMSGDIEPNEPSREKVAASASRSVVASGGFNGHKSGTRGFEYIDERSPTVIAGKPPNVVVYENHGQDSRTKQTDVFPIVSQKRGTGGNNTPLVCYSFNKDECSTETVGTLTAHKSAEHDNSLFVSFRNGTVSEISDTLQTRHNSLNSVQGVLGNNTVRRVTPLEAERLQGYPDYWTLIPDFRDSKGKKRKASDTARYKALGNSIALPPWSWILERISAQYTRPATLGSCFDGIGGFSLIWECINGRGTAIWASEIDEYCIAVTRYRIG